MFSLLDGFSRYNQVLVSPDDQLKTTFQTPWGTSAYRKMPFGLINARATFHRDINIAFRGLIHNYLMLYLDYIKIYSKKQHEHFSALKQVFERCKKYEISINPNKSIFTVTEGKMLGFLVSKEGMIIDSECTKAISNIGLPGS